MSLSFPFRHPGLIEFSRAVKFIRDQAEAALIDMKGDKLSKGAAETAQAATSALRRILKGDTPKTSIEVARDVKATPPDVINPLYGWADGVSLNKGHCCLLLKPQIVLHGETPKEACIVAAVQAKLQSYAIMDDKNAEDPICGKVMSRFVDFNLSPQTCSFRLNFQELHIAIGFANICAHSFDARQR